MWKEAKESFAELKIFIFGPVVREGREIKIHVTIPISSLAFGFSVLMKISCPIMAMLILSIKTCNHSILVDSILILQCAYLQFKTKYF